VRLLRIIRLVRMARLLRLLKLGKVMRHVDDMIDSEYVSICVHIVRMIVLLLVINHLIGCAWFAIASTANGDTWVLIHGFSDDNWSYQYATAFHWSITQFTPASMHVQPQNMSERTFAIAVVVFALVVFSYLVGSITGSLTQLRSMQEDTHKQFLNLRRYLKQNRVPLALSTRIQRYLEHAWQCQRQSVSTRNTKLFSLLSEQLHSELQCEISLPHLKVHPLFDNLSELSSTTITMRRLANSALIRKLFARGDTMFISGESATHMYVVVEGWMEYAMLSPNGDEHVELVKKPEDWISEPVLWTPAWVHLGVLTAGTDCDLLLVDPKNFSDVVSRSPPAHIMAISYAQNFVRWLNSLEEDRLSDIWPDHDSVATVKHFMGHAAGAPQTTPTSASPHGNGQGHARL